MRVLITGGAGFIGSRLARRLIEAGEEVHVVDDLSLGTWRNLEEVSRSPRLKVSTLDCTTPEFAGLLEAERPQRVFHLAANSDISRGTREVSTDLQRTFQTTFAVLDAMRRARLKELVFASTSAIYGDTPVELREDHGPLRPISLYGAAKLASEAYLSAFCHLYDLRAWVFRFPNVVGPNLTHGAVMDFVRRLHRDRTRLAVLGDGTQTKPYLHVDDLLDAIGLALKTAPDPLTVYNVAGEGATSVREIAEAVRRGLGLPDAEIAYGTEPRGWPGDVPRFVYDTSRIRALGWRPKLTSTQAVEAAVADEVERCRRSS